MGRERVIRVGVAEGDSALSAVWRIWLNGSDVYVAIRNIAGEFKTSLHASGVYRHAFVTDQLSEQFRPVGADRAVSKWNRPPPQAKAGTLLFQILIPESELQPARHGLPLARDVVWLPRPPAGAVTYLSVLELVRLAPGLMPQFEGVSNTTALASWPTDPRSMLWTMVFVAPITGEQAEQIASARVEITRQAVQRDLSGDHLEEPRAHWRGFGLLQSPDGVGRIVDLNLEFLRESLTAAYTAAAHCRARLLSMGEPRRQALVGPIVKLVRGRTDRRRTVSPTGPILRVIGRRTASTSV